jgi:hypothetical protein
MQSSSVLKLVEHIVTTRLYRVKELQNFYASLLAVWVVTRCSLVESYQSSGETHNPGIPLHSLEALKTRHEDLKSSRS